MSKRSEYDNKLASSLISSRKRIIKPQEGPMPLISTLNYEVSPSDCRKCSSVKRLTNDHTLSSIIEAKVTSLKTKIEELSCLRKKISQSSRPSSVESKHSGVFHTNLHQFDLNLEKNKEFLHGAIFRTEDRRCKPIELSEKDSDTETKKKFGYKPDFDKLLFENETSRPPENKSTKFDIEGLKFKLRATEKELRESERQKLYQETLLIKKDKELRDIEERFRGLIEVNKSLRIKVERLEGKLNSGDKRKDIKMEAIKNLSGIILSKEDSEIEIQTKKDASNGIVVKYLDTLNELHSADQFTMCIFEKMKGNQLKEAFKMISDIQKTIHVRLINTRKNVDELERILYKPEIESLAKNENIHKSQTVPYLETNEFFSFIKCQASAVEQLLFG